LSRFYDSFKERAGSDPSVMRKMFIAERERDNTQSFKMSGNGKPAMNTW